VEGASQRPNPANSEDEIEEFAAKERRTMRGEASSSLEWSICRPKENGQD